MQDIVGTIVGQRYRVERYIGSGRFASVYAAVDTDGNARVAIKIFKPSTSKRTVVGERFFRRTRAAKKSPHPVIVPIADSGRTADGSPFLVMELLDGRTVEQDVAIREALPVSRSLHIASCVLEGLAAAHDEGLVHRNVNPANVFLIDPQDSEPVVRLLDMGVARDLVDYLAIAPSSIGSTRYLAPEILLDSDKAWTASVDVFAVGMVLFFMLTGRLPFDKEAYVERDKNTIKIYTSILKLPAPSKFVHNIPRAVDEVVSRSLTIEPFERYKNAREMLDDLRKARSKHGLSSTSRSHLHQSRDRAPAGSPSGRPFRGFDAPIERGIESVIQAYADLYSTDVPPFPDEGALVPCDPTAKITLPEAEDDDDTMEARIPEASASGSAWIPSDTVIDGSLPGSVPPAAVNGEGTPLLVTYDDPGGSPSWSPLELDDSTDPGETSFDEFGVTVDKSSANHVVAPSGGLEAAVSPHPDASLDDDDDQDATTHPMPAVQPRLDDRSRFRAADQARPMGSPAPSPLGVRPPVVRIAAHDAQGERSLPKTIEAFDGMRADGRRPFPLRTVAVAGVAFLLGVITTVALSWLLSCP